MPRADASDARSGPELLWSSAQASEVRKAGLTLLEVLGAVALLGILYTALAGSAIEGLRSEGESRRRLEASLLVDDRLTQLELSLASGVTPPIGTDEQEVDGFTVATDVRPFELPPRPEADEARAEPTSLAAKRAAARAKDAPSLFAPPRGAAAPAALLSVEIVVRWQEGIFQREVRRRTYAVDATAVEAAFEALAEFQGERPPEEPTGEAAEGQPQEQPGAPLPDFEIPLPGPPGKPGGAR